MNVIIDRFEGDYAIVEIDENTFVNMPKVLIDNAKEGDVISISVNHDETKKRKANIQKLVNDLFED